MCRKRRRDSLREVAGQLLMYCRDQEIGDGERGPIGSPEKRAKLSDALEHYKKMESAWKEANQEIASMCMRRDILSHAPGPEVHDDRVPEPLCPETGVLKPECRGSPGEGSSPAVDPDGERAAAGVDGEARRIECVFRIL